MAVPRLTGNVTDIYKSRSGMNRITKGQLNFLLRSIRKQIQGYGIQFIRREDEYKARIKEYWEDYWFDPENI